MCPVCKHKWCLSCEMEEPNCAHYLTCCECRTISRRMMWGLRNILGYWRDKDTTI